MGTIEIFLKLIAIQQYNSRIARRLSIAIRISLQVPIVVEFQYVA